MINETPQKNYYAVITANILYNKHLTPRQKLLVACISNLSNDKGYCWASNSYFSEILNCEERSIQRDLKVLEDFGILGRIIQLDSNGQFKMRTLTIIDHASSMTGGGVKSDVGGGVTDDAHNNKEYINNKEEYILSDFEVFLHFWNVYGRKEGKLKAMNEWKKLSEEEKQIALAHAPKYVQGKEKRYLSLPEKYLREKRFNDEIVVAPPAKVKLQPHKLLGYPSEAPSDYRQYDTFRSNPEKMFAACKNEQVYINWCNKYCFEPKLDNFRKYKSG